MNTDRLNRWLTLGANLGVLAGLILVAYEIHQSGTQLDITASADSADNFAQAMETLVQSEELSRLIYRAENFYEELDDFEKWRVSKYLDGFFTMSQQDFQVYMEVGGVPDTAMTDDWRENMRRPMYREYWQQSQERYDQNFKAYINGILADENRKPLP